MTIDAYTLICLLSTAFPGLTCKECREAIDRLKEAGYNVTGLQSIVADANKE